MSKQKKDATQTKTLPVQFGGIGVNKDTVTIELAADPNAQTDVDGQTTMSDLGKLIFEAVAIVANRIGDAPEGRGRPSDGEEEQDV